MAWKLLILSLFSLSLFAAEDDVYRFKWLDDDKKVFVLQNKQFRKENRFFLSLSGGLTTSGEFTDGNNIQARLGYFFHENWGIKLLYSMNNSEENDSAEAIIAQGTVPFYRTITNYVGGAVQWAPFYSKINTFNSIIYADWILGLGAVSVSDENNSPRFSSFSNQELVSESHVALTWNISFVLYFSKHWAARFDATGLHYNADQFQASGISSTTKESKLFSHYDLSLGVQYIF